MVDKQEKKMVDINDSAPSFKGEAYIQGEVKQISLEDYKGKWVVLFFYPADFTFVCPTELGELAANYEKFKELNGEVISISTDTVFVHKAWHDHSETIKKISFPMLADPTGQMCRAYGTMIESEGLSTRASFVIDPDGVIKAYEMHDNSVGRSIKELLRKVKAAKFVRENGAQVCPVEWEPGKETLQPGLDLVGKI
jgi:NADH-dependent peroxiredoxin subunit C